MLDEVRQWQNRPLEARAPIVYVGCLVVEVRENEPYHQPSALPWHWAWTWKDKKVGMWLGHNEGAEILVIRLY